MKLRPLGDDILIHPIDDPSVTEGGLLYIPEKAKQRIDQGIVIAKGPLVSSEIDIGDHVIFSGYSGDKVSVGSSGQFFVIPEPFVVAILQDSPVVLMDTLTLHRILDERRGELLQVHSGHSTTTKLVQEVFNSIRDRVDTITRAEGFEW